MFKPLSLDRFAQGIRDQQEAPVILVCAHCEGEIYGSEPVYVMPGGDIIHADTQCLADYTGADLMSAEEALGVAI